MHLIFYVISLCLFLVSCNNLDFVYKNNDDLKNPIYKKTTLYLSGVNIPSFYGQALKYLGEDEEMLYQLKITTDEEKIKRSVESNQAISKLDYKIIFKYELLDTKMGCFVFEKEIISRFTFEPKSSGQNFGSDQALNGLYETAGKNNLQQFIGYVSNDNLKFCINES